MIRRVRLGDGAQAIFTALPLLFAGVLVGCGGDVQAEGSTTHTNAAHHQLLGQKLHRLRREVAVERRRLAQGVRSAAAAKTRAERRPAHPVPQAPETPPIASSSSSNGSTAAFTGKVVAIDPGHNGGNGAHPGIINRPVVAYADGRTKACDTVGTETNDGRLSEAQFNLDVAKALAGKLRAAGIGIVMTRTTNNGVGPCINRRAAIGNRAGADAAISIHADGIEAATAHGFDVIYPARDQLFHPAIVRPSTRLAFALRDALAKAGVPPANYVGSNGLDARDDLGGLNLSSIPKVFVELGNMRSASEAAKLETVAYRARLASALAAGIERFLGTR